MKDFIDTMGIAADQLSSFNHTYPSVEQSFHMFLLVAVWIILILTIVFGTTGNLLVLYVYINRKDNKTCTFFIKTLAVVDLIICLVLAPLELYQTTSGIYNEFFCKFYAFLNTHVLYSTLLITIIAFDRYFCICWPLYKIVTVHRAWIIVIICGLLTFLFAIIPMSEHSTREHILHMHKNYSAQLALDNYEEHESSGYVDVESIKSNAPILPYVLGNETRVRCSPRFSLHLRFSDFLVAYQIFHNTIFAVCLLSVLILYSCIYNAIYQRRRTRTKRFSTYQKILHSYLITNSNERRLMPSNCFLSCFTCNQTSPEVLSKCENVKYSHHEQSCVIKQKPKQILLEFQGARGKRYSAVSTTSMTYLTSGVWDEPSSCNVTRSRINSVAAPTVSGLESLSVNRPSTSTDDSRSIVSTNSTHLTVPGLQMPSLGVLSIENEGPSTSRKAAHLLAVRQNQRPSDLSLHSRKVSFMTSVGLADQCILEDPPSTNQQSIVHLSSEQSGSVSSSSSTDPQNLSTRNSISSTRRISVFDTETQRVFQRQQRQERLANIRMTLTLFIVTATFILMYLPSLIITLFHIKPYDFREVLFLLYYINSACNPLIYSFFNVNFRNDIRRIYDCQKREYFSR